MYGIILIVDDDKQLTSYLAQELRRHDFQVETAASRKEAQRLMALIYADITLIDLKLPDADGIDLLIEFKEEYPQSQAIMITGHGSIRSAVESTHRGAADYLTKPFEFEELLLAIRKIMGNKLLSEELQRLRTGESPFRERFGEEKHLGYKAPRMQEVLSLAELAAHQHGIVLLLGESGTGKDYLARWIHEHSPRKQHAFFAINCATLTEQLAESELFGHEPGAFTGTRGRKRGLLELADQGTLLLNEIGDISLSLQSKLLTFLDTRSFVRVGGERSISINARIFAATNKNLEQEVAQGSFRQDLFYRINVFPIELPPLRERKADIPYLIMSILAKLTADLGLTTPPIIEPDVMDILCSYSWPGNIRELRNVLERALMLARSNIIDKSMLNIQPSNQDWKIQVSFPPKKSLHDVVKEVTRELLVEALRRSQTKQEAAEMLGISRHALAYQLKAHNISDDY